MIYKPDKEGIKQKPEKQKLIKPGKLGIDEIFYKKGHVYITIVTAPNECKVLDVLKGRIKEVLESLNLSLKKRKWYSFLLR